MFSGLAGIDTKDAGYSHIIIRPLPPSPDSNPDHPPISWVRAHYESIHGQIYSAWKRTKDQFELDVSIPANTTATVYLPATLQAAVTESGNTFSNAVGVKLLHRDPNNAILSIESGTYHFVSK